MPIILDLVPTRPSFCSGEVLTATLEVWLHSSLLSPQQCKAAAEHVIKCIAARKLLLFLLFEAAIEIPLPQVRNVAGSDGASAGPLELAGVNVDFRGTERIDRSWIASSYAPSKGPVARDGKREVRPIVETPPARLVMQDYTLMLGESRMWLVRCVKPLALASGHAQDLSQSLHWLWPLACLVIQYYTLMLG